MTLEEKQCEMMMRKVEIDIIVARAVQLLKDLGYDYDGAIEVIRRFWEVIGDEHK